MIDEHGIDRKYTHHMSFDPEKWERIFGKTDTVSVEPKEEKPDDKS